MTVRPPGRGVPLNNAPPQKINVFPFAAAPTLFDSWRARQLARLDTVGQAMRSIKLFGPGQTPTRTRTYLAGRGRCTLAELRAFDAAIREFEMFEREMRRYEKMAGRRAHG